MIYSWAPKISSWDIEIHTRDIKNYNWDITVYDWDIQVFIWDIHVDSRSTNIIHWDGGHQHLQVGHHFPRPYETTHDTNEEEAEEVVVSLCETNDEAVVHNVST